jgi:hypothetical protein
MAEKDNIISLQEQRQRRRGKSEAAAPDGGEGPGGGKAAAKVTDTTSHAATETATEPLPGKLVWMRCPTCGTVEYTEVVMTGGRTHNVCGTQVEEVELDIDVRAEYTIAGLNLERLELLAGAVQAQRERYEEYQRRLRLIARANVLPYPVSGDTLQPLPVAEMDPMGLLVPQALHDPARHFAATGDEEEGGPPAPDPDSQPPKP